MKKTFFWIFVLSLILVVGFAFFMLDSSKKLTYKSVLKQHLDDQVVESIEFFGYFEPIVITDYETVKDIIEKPAKMELKAVDHKNFGDYRYSFTVVTDKKKLMIHVGDSNILLIGSQLYEIENENILVDILDEIRFGIAHERPEK